MSNDIERSHHDLGGASEKADLYRLIAHFALIHVRLLKQG
jgi:hypothetical protein